MKLLGLKEKEKSSTVEAVVQKFREVKVKSTVRVFVVLIKEPESDLFSQGRESTTAHYNPRV